MIQIYNVSMSYKEGITVLHDVSFSIQKGEFVFLVGPSGSGKTTILRLLYRDLVPTSGEIVVAGKNLGRITNAQLPFIRRRMGIVFQDFKLLPHKTVYENVALALKVTGMSRSNVRKNVMQLLHRTGLTYRQNAYPEGISGGEQQRTAIARAMANDPLILFADEPTGNLDPKLSLDIMHLFESFNFRGTTVLVATHDIALVRQLNKRVIRLEEGRVIT